MSKKICFILMSIALFFTFIVVVQAQQNYDNSPDVIVESIEISEEEKEKYIESFCLKEIEYDPNEYKDKWIVSFDVSQEERIAVGFNNSTLLVADKEFNVEHVFSFETRMKTYYVNWNGNNIEIIFNRSYLTYLFSEEGELLDVSLKDKSEMDQLRKIIRRKTDVSYGNTYKVKNSSILTVLFADKYDILSRISENEEQILFESAKKVSWFRMMAFLIPIIGSQAFGIFIIVSTLKIRKERLQGKHIENPYAKYFR